MARQEVSAYTEARDPDFHDIAPMLQMVIFPVKPTHFGSKVMIPPDPVAFDPARASTA